MKTYELTAVLSVRESLTQEGKASLEQELSNQQFSIESTEDMGQKLLAYPIYKEDHAHYLFYNIKGEQNRVESLRAALSLVGGLLRFLIVDPTA